MLTDEQISRVLSAHEAGQLVQCGFDWNYDPITIIKKGCIIQVATLEKGKWGSGIPNYIQVVEWFDREYREYWTVDQFIEQLEKQGLL